MTDTIEAAQLADMICDCANRDQHRRDVKLIEDYVADRITVHTKALIEGAGELKRFEPLDMGSDFVMCDHEQGDWVRYDQAAATIAALKAEIERLTEREAQVKLANRIMPLAHELAKGITREEMRANLSADLYAKGDCVLIWANEGDLCLIAARLRALDAEAIAKGEG